LILGFKVGLGVRSVLKIVQLVRDHVRVRKRRSFSDYEFLHSFGGIFFPLPTPEEIRSLRKVGEVADEMTGGRFHDICMTDGPEEERIRRLAAQKGERQEARQMPPHNRVQRNTRNKQYW